MKYLILTPTLVYSAINNIPQRLESITTKVAEIVKNNETLSNAMDSNDDLTSSTTRNLAIFTEGQFALQGFQKIRNYGCYCNFVNFRNVGGEAKDEYDNACHRLHDNYLCTIEASKIANEPDFCNPDVDEYKSGTLDNLVAMAVAYKTVGLTDLSNEMIRKAYDFCDYMNDESSSSSPVCLQGACKAETKFIFEVQPNIGLYMDANKFAKNEFVHTGNEFVDINDNIIEGTFDYQSECITVVADKDPKCCGDVPDSVRFNSIKRGCCFENVFSKYTHCCGEDGVEMVGSCV